VDLPVATSARTTLDAGTILLTLVCLVVVFTPVLVEARRLLDRLPRRNAESPPLASDADVEDAVARLLYGREMGSKPRSSTARKNSVATRRPVHESAARIHEGVPRAHAWSPASEHRDHGSGTPDRRSGRRSLTPR
jgi:hypothetical protein